MLVLLLGLPAAACGDGGGGPGSNIPPATCTAGQLALLGDLDGQHLDASIPFAVWTFQQRTKPYALDLPYAFDGDALRLEWNTLIPGDVSVAASGSLVMPAGVPHAGETICGATGTMKYHDIDVAAAVTNYTFTLTDLSWGWSCPGYALAGSLAGCAQTTL